MLAKRTHQRGPCLVMECLGGFLEEVVPQHYTEGQKIREPEELSRGTRGVDRRGTGSEWFGGGRTEHRRRKPRDEAPEAGSEEAAPQRERAPRRSSRGQ